MAVWNVAKERKGICCDTEPYHFKIFSPCIRKLRCRGEKAEQRVLKISIKIENKLAIVNREIMFEERLIQPKKGLATIMKCYLSNTQSEIWLGNWKNLKEPQIYLRVNSPLGNKVICVRYSQWFPSLLPAEGIWIWQGMELSNESIRVWPSDL